MKTSHHQYLSSTQVVTAYSLGVFASLMISCTPILPGVNPDATVSLQNAPMLALDGLPQELEGSLASIGMWKVGDALQLRVAGVNVQFYLVLLGDAEGGDFGLVAGGGDREIDQEYRVNIAGEYFLFVQYDPAAPFRDRAATIEVEHLSEPAVTPTRQLVQLVFPDGFLNSPGLWDPVDGTEDDKAFLASISDFVRGEIKRELGQIFAGTPIEFVDSVDPTNKDPVSRVTFSPERLLADKDAINDAALPQADPSRPECQVRVVFGEIRPRGTRVDPGNRRTDDEAVVYVGSFQGRGESCWTSAVGSVNSVVLTLAQTAAHEIGHLVGLQHVEQIDLMNRSATLAFLRELQFARGQLQLDGLRNGQVVSEVFPMVVQDPDLYFEAVFGTGSPVALGE